MQDTELVFDEEYINGMAEYFEKQGKQLQKMSDDYVKAMRRIVESGIKRGDTAESLRAFLQYAEKLNRVIASTAVQIRDSTADYWGEIDARDQYRVQ
ncbi:MAG: hypothetical protein K1W26_18940 [Acetatifactor sp.]